MTTPVALLAFSVLVSLPLSFLAYFAETGPVGSAAAAAAALGVAPAIVLRRHPRSKRSALSSFGICLAVLGAVAVTAVFTLDFGP